MGRPYGFEFLIDLPLAPGGHRCGVFTNGQDKKNALNCATGEDKHSDPLVAAHETHRRSNKTQIPFSCIAFKSQRIMNAGRNTPWTRAL